MDRGAWRPQSVGSQRVGRDFELLTQLTLLLLLSRFSRVRLGATP